MQAVGGSQLPPMPWFGMDIGGTLTKLVYFEPTDVSPAEEAAEHHYLKTIKRYLTSHVAYGTSGVRDKHLELPNQKLRGRTGTLHFIRFPTAQMPAFIRIASEKNFSALADRLCATGGGAYKFENEVKEKVNLHMVKYDELVCLLKGIHFIDRNSPFPECYSYEQADSEAGNTKRVYLKMDTSLFPSLVVNIGSGVSILAVKSSTEFKRVCGTSIGGGTFLGLSCLLAKASTYEEAIALASSGDHKNVDRLVKDIYGGDYGRFGLGGDTIAASFGNMMSAERRLECQPADLCRSTLMTVTNNIGSLAMLCANQHEMENVIFVGNFLRSNDISTKLLAYALNFWSQGKLKALFLEHLGYFGATGCLLELLEANCD